jgi:hypothetical protein
MSGESVVVAQYSGYIIYVGSSEVETVAGSVRNLWRGFLMFAR